MRTLYTLNMRDAEFSLTYGEAKDLSNTLRQPLSLKRGRNGNKKMSPTNQAQENGASSASTRVTRSVFDLKAFDNIQLGKEVELPKKPQSMTEVSEMFQNNTQKLLDLIYEGMCQDAKDTARKDLTGYRLVDEETNKLGDLYEGKYAEGDKSDVINGAILAIAKLNGFGKDKSADEKRALKEKAREFLRANPAMIESLQG